jgi:hypothetical protein
MGTLLKIVGAIVVASGIILTVALLTAFFIQYLWNTCLIGAVDGIHKIGFWQAFGIAVLCGFLFKTSVDSSSTK